MMFQGFVFVCAKKNVGNDVTESSAFVGTC